MLGMESRPLLVAVTFHRVGDDQPISTEKMRDHLALLARHFEMIGPTELVGGKVPQRAAIVSVDDGHRDIFDCMFPVALELKVPITVCVATDYVVRRKWLWFDLLEWIFFNAESGREGGCADGRVVAGDRLSLAATKKTLKRYGSNRRTQALLDLAHGLGVVVPEAPVPLYAPFTTVEMKEMVDSGMVQICAHTVSHTIATVLGDEELNRELVCSKTELETLTERPVVGFCYPNGNPGDFDARTTAAVKSAGFGMAMTSVEGLNPLQNFDPFLIKRVHAQTDLAVFAKEIAGIGELQRHLGLGSGN